jgi:hypothetical protein
MVVEQKLLDKATVAARRAQNAIGRTLAESEGQTATFARLADDAITEAVRALLDAGADDKDQRIADSFAMEIPFHALAPKELGQLEQVLTEACGLADKVDTLRGRADGGEGLDLGEQVRQLLARISLELHGPDTGGRE